MTVNNFRRSPHNSLDSSDSGKSVKLAEDSDGFLLARASDHCKTFWLSKTKRPKEPKTEKQKLVVDRDLGWGPESLLYLAI